MAGRARAELVLHLHPRADPRRGGIYDGHCRDLGLGRNAALRLRQTRPVLQFSDRLRGTLIATSRWRVRILLSTVATGCSPYNLAVVVDDHFQGDHRDCPRRRPD